jgi:hypothetical protein
MWGGVKAAIDKFMLGAISNEGILTLDNTNNPEGGVKTTILQNKCRTYTTARKKKLYLQPEKENQRK